MERLLFSEEEIERINRDAAKNPRWGKKLKSSIHLPTEMKPRVIEAYLNLFVKVTKHGTYLDGFAGPQTEEDDSPHWSARRVVESQHRWFSDPAPRKHLRRFYLFDSAPEQVRRLRETLGSLSRGNAFNVTIEQGDANRLVPEVLEGGELSQREAIFVLLDQRSTECHWKTLDRIARSRPQSRFKPEIFYFLGTGWMHRKLSALGPKRVFEADQWWGSTGWRGIPRGKTDLALKMRDRFQAELGYKIVTAWPFTRTRDSQGISYFMIHATDHPAAERFMDRAFSQLGISPHTEREQLCLEMD